MKYPQVCLFLLAIFLTASPVAHEVLAQVPQMLPYTGVIEVNGELFSGDGQFKFAIIGSGSASFWSNDNSSIAGSQPLTFVRLPVNDGVFTVNLGDISLMETIPVSVFDTAQKFLRVWFNDGTTGFQELSPDRQLVSVPYAYRAEVADSVRGSGTIEAGFFVGDGSGLTEVSGLWSQGANPKHIFRGTGTEEDPINSERIGVNIPVPTYNLDVKGDSQLLSLERIKNLEHANQFDFRINFHNLEINPRGQAGNIVFFASADDTVGDPVQTGNVGIGTTNPIFPLHMASGAHVSIGGVWTNASSRAYKENIREISGEEAQKALGELVPVQYHYKVDKKEAYLGFIAEDVPKLVATRDRKSLSPMDIVAVLTKVLQNQQSTISALEERIMTLEELNEQKPGYTALSRPSTQD